MAEDGLALSWGLLGWEQLGGTRRTRTRTRTLGVGAVRRFNELAVPGMGNVWLESSATDFTPPKLI